MTLGVTLSGPLTAVSKERWQEVGGMIPDSLSPGAHSRLQFVFYRNSGLGYLSHHFTQKLTVYDPISVNFENL